MPNIETVAGTLEHEELFFQSAEFWVGAAFVLVVAALYIPIVSVIKNMMINRISRIKNELQEAENLKLEAQKLYADYERKFLNTENEVSEIIANQARIIEETKNRKLNELDAILKQKESNVDAKIELAFAKTNAEINTLITNKMTDILQKTLREYLSDAEKTHLINNSIQNIADMNLK